MAEAFSTKQLFEWLNQVSDDPSTSHAAFHEAFALSRHFNRKSGDAWPSQATLAAAIRTTDRTVRRLTDELVEGGHLAVVSGRGRYQSNHFRMVIKNRTQASALGGENRTPASALKETKTGHPCPENRTPVSNKPDTHVRQNLKREPLEEPSESLSPANADLFGAAEPSTTKAAKRSAKKAKFKAPESQFEAFWEAYPRKVDRLEARHKFDAVIGAKEATFEQLMAGVSRYAAAQSATNPKYIKRPGTWFSKGCWLDEREEPVDRQRPRSSYPPGNGGAVSTIQGIISNGDEELP
jgi:hypothetical protein